MKRLGIIRLSAIGDVIHAMPLAMGLRERYPDAQISWVVQRAAAPLLENHPAIDEVLLFPRRAGIVAWGRFVRELRRRRFDVVVDPQGNLKSGLVGWLSGAPVRCGLSRADCRERANIWFTNRRGEPAARPHGVDRAWAAAGPLGLEPGPDRWGLRATDTETAAWEQRCRTAGADPQGALLAMHLTDPKDARSWFADAWREVARRAVDAGYQVILNGIASEAPLAASIRGPGIFDLCGKDDLRGLLAQFESMAAASHHRNLLLSPDSGPAHLAVAVGLKVLCLSGSQDPRRTGPRGGAAVHAWEGLCCAPCLERHCIRRPPDRACMRALPPDLVWERLLRLRDDEVEPVPVLPHEPARLRRRGARHHPLPFLEHGDVPLQHLLALSGGARQRDPLARDFVPEVSSALLAARFEARHLDGELDAALQVPPVRDAHLALEQERLQPGLDVAGVGAAREFRPAGCLGDFPVLSMELRPDLDVELDLALGERARGGREVVLLLRVVAVGLLLREKQHQPHRDGDQQAGEDPGLGTHFATKCTARLRRTRAPTPSCAS